ncbi:hypothetical protein E1A91_D10G277800v1 [Gossypium mustelinum]|uniref:F-box domain-containing protein n=1 Tax=Gossypium mustelinum TaxID=34275 RepID=A0A5D2TC08_GOSMU|nr:hypothetical protein E1A91_D10G277800v1 [Gossypium mustelinum]
MQMPRFKVPEVLVTEILSKLPVKSLIRFNCVCKYWCSSFQTPCFISKHYHNNLKKNNLNPLLQRTDGNADIPYFSQLSVEKGENFLVKQNIRFPFFIHDSPCVWGARRGLFCLHSALMDDTKVAIWNPSTREFKILPPSSVQRPTYPGLSCKHVFFDCGAFEFDFKTDDYKFIRFVTLCYVDSECGIESPEVSQVELYSLKCDSWKEIPSPNYSPLDYCLSNNCLDGICYWIIATGNSPYEKVMILSFDMANEKFSVSPILEFVGFFSKININVLVFNGSVGVLVYPVEGIDKSFDLWVMNGEEWTKQFSIESIPGVVDPLGFWKNNELFLLNTNYEVVLFDPSTQELKVLGINSYLDHHREYVSLFFYVESLVSINGIQEHKDHIIRQLVGDASKNLNRNIDQVDTKYDDG